MGETYKSRYYPSFPKKYKGDPNNIICRSSWERKMCRWCDLNENVLQWGSEEFSIPYVSPIDNRVHKYFPDFIVKLRENSGRTKTYVIEVKPKKQTRPPKPGKRKTKSFIYETMEYAKNQAKWKAAEEFCADRMIEFKIITEDELGIK
jgi:hypothetical protein